MRRILITTVCLAAAYLAGCSTIQSVIGTDTTDGARKAAGAAMTVYRDSWQPMLAVYAHMPACSATVKAPCQDPALYRKLYDLDGAASTCIVASTIALNEANPDFSGVTSCVQSINQSELAFAQAGIVRAAP